MPEVRELKLGAGEDLWALPHPGGGQTAKAAPPPAPPALVKGPARP